MSVHHRPHRPDGGIDPAVLEAIKNSIAALEKSAAIIHAAVEEVAAATGEATQGIIKAFSGVSSYE